MKKLRIAYLSDQEITCKGLNQISNLLEFHISNDIISLVERDVFMIDYDFLKRSDIGIESIIFEYKDYPIIAYSSTSLPKIRIESLFNSGLNAFLLKSDPIKSLITCINLLSINSNVVIKDQIKHKSSLNLNQKDIKILELISIGKTNKEISKELNFAVSTIELYVSDILRKLETSSRVEAVVKAIKYHYLSI